MFGIGFGKQWNNSRVKSIAVDDYGIEVRYTTKVSNGFRGVYSSSIGPYVRNNQSVPYNTSSWFIWQDLAGMVRFQQVSDYPPSPTADVPAGLAWLAQKDLTSVGLAFDQKNSRVVVWSYGDKCGVSYYDENTQLQQTEWKGYDAVVFFDGIFLGNANSDVIVFYLDASRRKIYYRLQRDRYSVEYLYYEFRTSFFQYIPKYNLDHIEITQHTFVLYLTDNSGREVQLESYSYGFLAQDTAMNVVSVGSIKAQYIQTLNSGLSEKTLTSYSIGGGTYQTYISSQYANDSAFVNISVSGGTSTTKRIEIDLSDSAVNFIALSSGAAYEVSSTVNNDTDFTRLTVAFSSGSTIFYKVNYAADSVSASASVSSGTFRQQIFAFTIPPEYVTNTYSIGESFYLQSINTADQISDPVASFVEIRAGTYKSSIDLIFSEESAQNTVSVSSGSYLLKIYLHSEQEATYNTIAFTSGLLLDASKLYTEDFATNVVFLNYGAHYQNVFPYSALDSALNQVSIPAGSYRHLNQLFDMVSDRASTITSLGGGVYTGITVRISSTQEAVSTSISIAGGLYFSDIVQQANQEDVTYFVSPGSYGYSIPGGYTSVDEELSIIYFMED